MRPTLKSMPRKTLVFIGFFFFVSRCRSALVQLLCNFFSFEHFCKGFPRLLKLNVADVRVVF